MDRGVEVEGALVCAGEREGLVCWPRLKDAQSINKIRLHRTHLVGQDLESQHLATGVFLRRPVPIGQPKREQIHRPLASRRRRRLLRLLLPDGGEILRIRLLAVVILLLLLGGGRYCRCCRRRRLDLGIEFELGS